MRQSVRALCLSVLAASAVATSGCSQAVVSETVRSYGSSQEFVDAMVSALGGCGSMSAVVYPPLEENPSDVLVSCGVATGEWNKGQGAPRGNPADARRLVCGGRAESWPKVVGGNWDVIIPPEEASIVSGIAESMGGTETTIGAFVGC